MFVVLSPAFAAVAQVSVKFSVDVSMLIADNQFNTATDHFIFYCTSQDVSVLTAFPNKLKSEYNRIVTSLQTMITQKISVYIFKNDVYCHGAI